MGKKWKQWQTLFSWTPKSLQMVTCSHEIKKTLNPWKKSCDQPGSMFKSRDIILPTKVHLLKALVFPVVMYGCESWTIKKAECWRIDAFELWCWRRLFRVPWSKEIHLVYPKGNQSWIFVGNTDNEAETPILWPPHAKSWLIGKDPNAGRNWRQEEKGMTEDEMAGWHHWLHGCEFEWTPGVGDGQGGLVSAVHGITKSRTGLSDWTDWIEGSN